MLTRFMPVSHMYARWRHGIHISSRMVTIKMETQSSEVVKSHKSAVVIIPPEHCWKAIQDIRKKHDKAYYRWMPHINLVYPFVPDDNEGKTFLEASDKIRKTVSEFQPFWISLSANSFNYFVHGKNCTLWLKPLCLEGNRVDMRAEGVLPCNTAGSVSDEKSKLGTLDLGSRKRRFEPDAVTCPKTKTTIEDCKHPDLMKLQELIQRQFPGYEDLGHISEGGYTPHLSLGQFPKRRIDFYREQFSRDWPGISFQVDAVHLISRADYHDPFHIRLSVQLGQT